ncbi:protein neprosin-like [Bidens hawaiensis]|uniref:protein neprosin-like n=1 Tax=Bidens hawaiensis TaxID=980011 RepID=UPI00404B9189
MYLRTFGFVVVFYLFTVASVCYAGKGSFPVAAEKVEILKYLKRVNKPAVQSIKSPDGDIIDCVNIYDQPALDHPSLKNHTIQMKPDFLPNWINNDKTETPSMMNGSEARPPIAQLWHTKGKCPQGTIPIRRTKMEDILRTGSLKNYQRKRTGFLTAHPDIVGPDGANHEYATLHAPATNGPTRGTKVTMNIWNPRVEGGSEFSLSQLWVVAGSDSSLNTIEAGWHVNPPLYQDSRTRLFIFSTTDGYHGVNCYNLACSNGFIQNNRDVAIGGSITPISQMDDSQYDITISVAMATDGNWWLEVNGKAIGYWPKSWFTSLSEGASEVSWGGEVINERLNGHHTTTEMGSGRFPAHQLGEASYIKNIQIRDPYDNIVDPPYIQTSITNPTCYDIITNFDQKSGRYFYFGGPGYNANCP